MDKLMQYERVFRHFDANGDGRISASELRQRLRSIGGDISETDGEAAVGSGGDGSLGLEDFVKLVEGERNEEERERDLREAFKMYEMDGCGFITPDSLRTMLGKLSESKSVDQCRFMICAFDLDGDGVLSFDEFLVMMS